MALTSISITPQFGNSTVTAINCGTSIPRLGGTIDLSAFPNLQQFACNSNDITALSGYAQNSNLINVQFYNNKVTGPIPTLSGLTGLQTFLCFSNLLTGPIPALSGLRNLQNFQCYSNQLTGPIPTLSGLTGLQTFICQDNLLSGPIPALSGLTNLVDFRCKNNPLGGSIPSLSGLNNLQNFQCQINSLVGTIPALTGFPVLNTFLCHANQLTGPIPSLNGLSAMQDFRCWSNLLTNYAGGSVSNTLGNFQAHSNQLNQSAVDAILSAFDATTRTTGTRTLTLNAGTNAAPSYTGGTTTTSAGTNFSRSGTLVTANVTGHGHPNGSLVTISGITETAFQGTFVITAVNANQFQYTTQTSGTVTGTGTATMRRTTVATDGFRYYQNLALVTRLGGFPWGVSINFP